MLQFAAQPSSKNNLPPRTTSLSIAASKAPIFTEIDEELHDIKRVHTHGQEDDLRMGMSRMISRVEQLSSLLKEAYKAQTDLQTELTLAKSNLQLALANNEMLEDALNRDVPGSSKDVGWRRWGAKEQKEREMSMSDSRRQSIESSRSASMDVPSPSISSPVPSTSDSRFFRFRFGSGANANASASVGSATSTSFPASPRLPGSPAVNGHASHLTSASLPSLVPQRDEELEKLNAELERERKALKEATAAKQALEAELESLSQALFEEANNMVATERRKLAETEDELKEAQAEKEALRSALRLVESQRATPVSGSEMSSPELPSLFFHSRSVSGSSAMAIKSPPSESPSSSPTSPSIPLQSQPSSATSSRTIVPSSTATSDSSTAGSTSTSTFSSSSSIGADSETTKTPSVHDKRDLPKVDEEVSHPSSDSESEHDHTFHLEPPTPRSPESLSSPSSRPSPDEAVAAPLSIHPVAFFEEESSPWADVRSASNTPRLSAEV